MFISKASLWLVEIAKYGLKIYEKLYYTVLENQNYSNDIKILISMSKLQMLKCATHIFYMKFQEYHQSNHTSMHDDNVSHFYTFYVNIHIT